MATLNTNQPGARTGLGQYASKNPTKKKNAAAKRQRRLANLAQRADDNKARQGGSHLSAAKKK